MATMASLIVEVGANIASFVSEMTKMEAVSTKQAKAIRREFTNLAGQLAGVFSVGLMAKFVHDTIEVQDQVSKMSQKTGVAVETLSALRYAASLSDVSLESMAKGMKKLSQEMVSAGDGTSKQARLFTTMGVDIKSGVTPALMGIADVFQKLPDGPTKAALAVELFGKAGMDMIPMLNQGAAGLRAMQEEAIRLGIVMTEDGAKAMEQFNDNLKSVKFASEGVVVSMTNNLAPSMVRVSKAMKEAAIQGGTLTAVWVGLGGLAAEAMGLNDTPAEKSAQRIKELQQQINAFEEQNLAIKEAGIKLNDLALRAREKGLEAARLELSIEERIVEARAGKFADQASRAQGRKNNLPFGGVDSGLDAKIRGILSGSDAKKEIGADMLLKMQEEQAKLMDQTLQSTHLDKVQLELKKEAYKFIKPAMKQQILDQAKLLDGLEAENRTRAFLNDEHAKELEHAKAMGDQLESMSNQWADNTRSMEDELRYLGMSNTMRQQAAAYEKARLDMQAAADGPSALRDINDQLKKQIDLLQQIEDAQNQLSVWEELANQAAGFAAALLDGPAKALDYMRVLAKKLLVEMVAVFAKRWLLQLGASMTGSSALSAAAGQVGQGTIAGAVGNAATSWFGNTALGGGLSSMGSQFAGGWSAVTMAGEAGAPALGASGGMAGTMGEMMASGFQWMMTNPWTAAAAVIIIAAIAIARMRSGGDKVGGSFVGNFDENGVFTGAGTVPSDNGRLFTPNGNDAAMQEALMGFGKNFYSTLERLGGKSKGPMTFGIGFDADPKGSAFQRVAASIVQNGTEVFASMMEAGKSEDDLQAAFATMMQRMLLAGLQNSDLPKGVAAILNSVSSATASKEDVQQILELASAFGALMEMVSAPVDVTELFKQASMTAMQQLAAQGEALLDMAGKAALTADDLGTLAQATNAYRQSTAQLLLQLESARKGIDDMFSQTIRGFEMSPLDDQGKYNYLQAEAEALRAQLMTATDVSTIQRLSERINQNLNESFALLSPEEQAAMSAEFIKRTQMINEEIAAHIKEVSDGVANAAQENLDRLQVVLDKMAIDNSAAASKQVAAAETQLAAAVLHSQPQTLIFQGNPEVGA